ncbi:hypothetical protein M3Y94_00994500 [Aphelenchoides besseyi]|nr:hypothetical protein M3Y94_00994500 [Aphelenchoides besseyi]
MKALLSIFSFMALMSMSMSQNCVDKATNCAESAYLCNSPSYCNLMREYCPVTCGFCPFYDSVATPSPFNPGQTFNPTTCVDSSQKAANGFCQNSFYTYSERYNYCRRTCGLCY